MSGYLFWVLGLPLAIAITVIVALWFDIKENKETEQ